METHATGRCAWGYAVAQLGKDYGKATAADYGRDVAIGLHPSYPKPARPEASCQNAFGDRDGESLRVFEKCGDCGFGSGWR